MKSAIQTMLIKLGGILACVATAVAMSSVNSA